MTFLSNSPSHPYVLVNRSVLCNCSIKADNYYFPESLAACDNRNSKLTMYFTINTAFTNYLEMFLTSLNPCTAANSEQNHI